MELSRVGRRQERVKILASRGKNALAAALGVALLALTWSDGDAVLFTALSVILFWATVLTNPGGIRKFFPWLNSASPLVRALAPLLYLVIVLAILGITGH